MNHDLSTRLCEITDKIGLFLVSRCYSTNIYACDEVQRKYRLLLVCLLGVI